MITLGEYVKIKTGKLDANASCDDGKYPFFTCAENPLKIDNYSYDCECVLVAGNGDLNVKYYNGKFDAYQRTYIIESLNKNILDTKYIFYFLSSYIEVLRHQSIGGIIKYIKLGNLTDAVIRVPTLDIQNKIVKNLNKLKNLISKREKQLEKLDQLAKSRFIEMFGDPVENEKNWKEIELKKLGDCKNGLNFNSLDNGYEIACLGVSDFKDLSFITGHELSKIKINKVPSEDYILRKNDIVFVRSNGNKNLVGRCLLVDPGKMEVSFSGFCIRFRLNDFDNILPIFLLNILKSDNMRVKMRGRGANIQNLNQSILSNLNIILPPLELQNEFASFIEQLDKSKFIIEKIIYFLEKLKSFYIYFV